ncbi:MAG: hypothetical protein Q9212_002965 [Teloschistes hypoglaucus]
METNPVPPPSPFPPSPVRKTSIESNASNPSLKAPKKQYATFEKPFPRVEGTGRPKQSKSRNGCVTCKGKRLKCDESKPSCQQCKKRKVPCGGYKKDFKWRAFEESTFTTKPIPSPNPSMRTLRPGVTTDDLLASATMPLTAAVHLPQDHSSDYDDYDRLEASLAYSETGPGDHCTSFRPSWTPHGHLIPQFRNSTAFYPTSDDLVPYHEQDHPPLHYFGSDLRLDAASPMLDDEGMLHLNATSSSPRCGSTSPRHMARFPPDSDSTHISIDSSYPSQPPSTRRHNSVTQSTSETPQHDNHVEEVVRQSQVLGNEWLMPAPLPHFSEGPGVLNVSPFVSSIYDRPTLSATSPEMLLLRFDRQTCGILSVKDGPTENPWRTMIWPLAQESPALYHALISMTAFHTSKNRFQMRVEGVFHMRKSIKYLAHGLANNDIRMDAALATTLALAFSESWDLHTSTGIQHLRGAKAMVNHARVHARRNRMTQEETARLQFLCSTRVYMDVIARLTSVDDDESNDFDITLNGSVGPSEARHKVDPLMGCASTFFPLIGRVANLVRRVSRTTRNTINIISQANELKTAVEAWRPPEMFEAPDDTTSDIEHSLDTAEAYRWATLLYLHQAVPEMPSRTSEELAQKVLVYLLKVPVSSRAVIVQIYPLLAAGCEVTSLEDRAWVKNRWVAMMQRMLIGNLDRCWEVVKEVWDRRDKMESERARFLSRTIHAGRSNSVQYNNKNMVYRQPSSGNVFDAVDRLYDGSWRKRQHDVEDWETATSMVANGPHRRSSERIEELEHDRTVRGRLHWVGVMKDWEWEILLG